MIGVQGWQVPQGVGGRSLLLPIRVLAGAQAADHVAVTGVGAIADIDAGLKVALDLGAQVINMSFGTPANAVDPEAPRPHGRSSATPPNGGARWSPQRQLRARRALLSGGVRTGRRGRLGLATKTAPRSVPTAAIRPRALGEAIVSVGRRGYRVSTGTSHAAGSSPVPPLCCCRAPEWGRSLEPRVVAVVLTATAGQSPQPPVKSEPGSLIFPPHCVNSTVF